jgi:hypothetical protein
MGHVRLVCLSVAACGALLAQETVTSVIANVGLGRLSLKVTAGPLTIDSTNDAFSGSFVKSVVTFTPQDPPELTTIGPCIVLKLGPAGAPPSITSNFLDAGPVMNITGPKGSKQVPQMRSIYSADLGGGPSFGFGAAPPPLYLDPGTYTVDNGGGGADVPAFSESITLPETFVWTNADANLSIDRSAPVDVTWTGGDPESKVLIGGAVIVTNPTTFQFENGVSFACTEVAGAGHFTIPSEVLSLLPVSASVNGVSNGSMSLINGVQKTFELAGFTAANLVFNSTTTRNVQYK